MGLVLGWRLAVADGWDALMLGPDLPEQDIADAARTYRAHAVTLSFVNRGRSDATIESVLRLRSLLPGDIALWFGAPGDHPVHRAASPPGLVGFSEYRSYHHHLASSALRLER